MTPAELKTARTQLGLSAQAFARLIGVHDGRTVRRWEAGEGLIPELLPKYLAMREVLGDIVRTWKEEMPRALPVPYFERAKKMLSYTKLGIDA